MTLLVPFVFRSSRKQPGWFTNFKNGALGCYKATVNESETITVAQEFCQVRTRARGLRG